MAANYEIGERERAETLIDCKLAFSIGYEGPRAYFDAVPYNTTTVIEGNERTAQLGPSVTPRKAERPKGNLRLASFRSPSRRDLTGAYSYYQTA